MGKVTTFRIALDSSDAVRAGDNFTGQVKLQLRDDLMVNEVRLSFTGLSSIQWAEAHKNSAMPEMNSALVDPVVGQEVYFTRCLTLWPPRPDGLEETSSRPPSPPTPTPLARGWHDLTFQVHVPGGCPSSFQGLNGCVLYKLTAVLETTPRKSGVRPGVEVTTRMVTVTSSLDLHDVTEARENVDVSRDLKARSLLLPSVDCGATMQLARKGFTPGEVIPVEFSVRNNSHHAIHNVCLLLKMVIEYRAGSRRCECERVLGRSEVGTVPPDTSLQGMDKTLIVPLTCPPSGLPGCSLINIQYRLQLKIKPFCLSLKRLKLQCDVIVGTSPLSASSLHDSPPDYWACCLPSYEEIMALAPPPYCPETSPSPSSSPLPPPPVEQPVTRHSGSPPSTSMDSLPGDSKSCPRAVGRWNSCPVVTWGRNPPRAP
ncbi:hypothetical protein ACOMHN_022893 [Nucella lapillus]